MSCHHGPFPEHFHFFQWKPQCARSSVPSSQLSVPSSRQCILCVTASCVCLPLSVQCIEAVWHACSHTILLQPQCRGHTVFCLCICPLRAFGVFHTQRDCVLSKCCCLSEEHLERKSSDSPGRQPHSDRAPRLVQITRENETGVQGQRGCLQGR